MIRKNKSEFKEYIRFLLRKSVGTDKKKVRRIKENIESRNVKSTFHWICHKCLTYVAWNLLVSQDNCSIIGQFMTYHVMMQLWCWNRIMTCCFYIENPVWTTKYVWQIPRWPTTHLLTYSMVQSPFWEVNRFAASQEIPCISRNPNVHYRTHKRPPPVSILGQPKPVHIPTFHLMEIHPNIIHQSTPRSPQWSFSLRFPHQDPIHPSVLTHTRHTGNRNFGKRGTNCT